MPAKIVRALALYSGGLDSTLACRLVQDQGIAVTALRFVTPFFGYELLERRDEYIEQTKTTTGIDVILVDVSAEYLELLRAPAHGYGKNFNPCLDCKIFILTKARALLDKLGASFLITGEVIGQRPMSQRRDAMRLIERDSNCDGLLLRPLCARNLPLTKPETENLIDREQLLDLSGRGRKPQIALAASYGITDYPSPAGGCILTDPILGRRIRRYYDEHRQVTAADIRFILVGRQFVLPGGSMLAVGRDMAENDRLLARCLPGDIILKQQDRPGPTAVLRHPQSQSDIEAAAGIVVRYGRKMPASPESTVRVSAGDQEYEIRVLPIEDTVSRPWQR